MQIPSALCYATDAALPMLSEDKTRGGGWSLQGEEALGLPPAAVSTSPFWCCAHPLCPMLQEDIFM